MLFSTFLWGGKVLLTPTMEKIIFSSAIVFTFSAAKITAGRQIPVGGKKYFQILLLIDFCKVFG